MADCAIEPTERVLATKSIDDSEPCALQALESADDGRNEGGKEQKALLFLDSMDDYLTLLDSLSSTLRQGWLELASARQSMGSSRVSSALLDLKAHSAETTLQLSELADGSPLATKPHFTLSKWASFKQNKEVKEVRDEVFCTNSESSRYRGKKQMPVSTGEISSATVEATRVDEQEK
ncbi:hypothetical protein AXF42_Ash013250 [Apostasia shenzhenica]|uniref:Vacuolar ATPase assembly protein VMA22 n=1 Tax=Apostasia shenzhenica TaxID=1088818 RepID=A0A2I0BBJ6_9ASPA|nr:hypothetical protein AXF42_Ash013250 [Apostasia shenzhenica]